MSRISTATGLFLAFLSGCVPDEDAGEVVAIKRQASGCDDLGSLGLRVGVDRIVSIS